MTKIYFLNASDLCEKGTFVKKNLEGLLSLVERLFSLLLH